MKRFLHPVTIEKVEVIRNLEIKQKVILDYVLKYNLEQKLGGDIPDLESVFSSRT